MLSINNVACLAVRRKSVSWLVAPANQSEHASNHPAAGEDLTARLLKVLQQNPDVYAKTAFIIDYDEGGQFFDHMWTPVPPATAADGESTVEVDGELIKTATEGVAAGSKVVKMLAPILSSRTG